MATTFEIPGGLVEFVDKPASETFEIDPNLHDPDPP